MNYPPVMLINSCFLHSFYLSYDAAADVLYVNFHSPAQAAYDSELTDEGAIVRYDAAGEVIGITILDVSDQHQSYL